MSRADRPLGQFQIRHLLGLLTLVAVPLALAAPWLRSLDAETQRRALIKALVALVAVIAIAAHLIRQRRTAETAGGALLLRCESRTSRVLKWFVALGLCLGYAATVLLQFVDAQQSTYQQTWDFFPGNPWILYSTVSYLVIRVWWNLDPTAIEARENGLAHGARIARWDEVQRYTWSGNPPRQLNLYYKARYVGSMKIDRELVEPLDAILASKIGQPDEAATSA